MSRVWPSLKAPASDEGVTYSGGPRVVATSDLSGVAGLVRLQGAGGNQMVIRLLSSLQSSRDAPGNELADNIRVQLGRGEPLPEGIRAEVQTSLGQPLRDVRLHRD